MTIRLAVVLLLAALAARCAAVPELAVSRETAFRVATFNLQYIEPDGPRHVGWLRRRDAVVAAIRDLDPDVLALQEVETFAGGKFNRRNDQLEWLAENLPDYAIAATGDVRRFPSTQPILYRRSRFRLLGEGFYALSETPDRAYSPSFDGRRDRFVSVARLGDRRSGETLLLHNIHFDHLSGVNRVRSAELAASRLGPALAAGENVILLGDANALAGSRAADILRAAKLELAPIPGGTFHFGLGVTLFPAIDVISHGPGLALAGRPFVLRRRYGGVLPSDHYPVAADFVRTPR